MKPLQEGEEWEVPLSIEVILDISEFSHDSLSSTGFIFRFLHESW